MTVQCLNFSLLGFDLADFELVGVPLGEGRPCQIFAALLEGQLGGFLPGVRLGLCRIEGGLLFLESGVELGDRRLQIPLSQGWIAGGLSPLEKFTNTVEARSGDRWSRKRTAQNCSSQNTPSNRCSNNRIYLLAAVLARFAPADKMLAIVKDQIIVSLAQPTFGPLNHHVGWIRHDIIFHLYRLTQGKKTSELRVIDSPSR